MTSSEPMDRLVREWLEGELDSLGTPERAVQGAMAQLPAVAQRRGRWPILDRLRRTKPTARVAETEPEVIVWGSAGRSEGAPVALPRSGRPVAVAAVMAVACLALMASMVGLVALERGRSPAAFVSASGLADSTAAPALLLGASDGSARQLVVDGQGRGHFWTISDALGAAVDGDTIEIAPGEYRESLVIDKDVVLRGTGAPGAVVLAPSVGASAEGERPVRIPDGTLNAVPDGFAMLGLRTVDETWDSQLLERGWRYVLYLDHTDATIADLTIRGSEIGTAVIIEGGTPTLSGLVIDPDGEQRNKTASEPHEAVSVRGGSSAIIRDSTIAAFVSVGDASQPRISGNRFDGTCVIVGGSGSQPLITGNRIEASQCPRYSLWVLGGASPRITSNAIVGDHLTDGLRINGEGSAPDIQGNTIEGADNGIWIGGGASGLIQRNHVSGARTGISVVDAHPTISVNDVVGNGVGLAIEGGDRPELVSNSICDNEQDLDIRDGEVSASAALAECVGAVGDASG